MGQNGFGRSRAFRLTSFRAKNRTKGKAKKTLKNIKTGLGRFDNIPTIGVEPQIKVAPNISNSPFDFGFILLLYLIISPFLLFRV